MILPPPDRIARMAEPAAEVHRVGITGVEPGGDGVARLDDGRVTFVRGALPGERVAVHLTEAKARFARAEVVEVLDPSPSRVRPPCPLVAAGCGGCGWQHVDVAHQRALKATIVADALRRIGRLAAVPEIAPGPALSPTAHRTTVRAGVHAGVAALRVHHGHDLVALDADGCLVAHPLVDEVLRRGRFGGAREVTVRAGIATGDRLVVVAPSVGPAVEVPEGVVVIGVDELRRGRRAWIHEDAGGRRWRVSAGSFFQTRADGAAALADVVAASALPALVAPPGGRASVVDLYGGVGLLGGVLAARAPAPVALLVVEANRSSAADARHNLADLPAARVVRADVRRWRPSKAEVVLADPSRHGLGAEVVDRIAATGARTLVLVSCDAPALGRDAGLLATAGFTLRTATLVDLFPHTPHVEVVTTWQR
jgi:23S rRNA (uracil1939-C5)-methyltransferase